MEAGEIEALKMCIRDRHGIMRMLVMATARIAARKTAKIALDCKMKKDSFCDRNGKKMPETIAKTVFFML